MAQPDFPNEPNHWRTQAAVALLAVCCIALVVWMKTAGIVLAVACGLVVFFFLKQRPDAQELLAIKDSIRLSADDITQTLDEFDFFVSSPHPDALADRTLTRPALADKDCLEPRIEKFHYLYASSLRFLNRLDARLASDLTVSQAESILAITDERALELQESWVQARRAAAELGPGYRPL